MYFVHYNLSIFSCVIILSNIIAFLHMCYREMQLRYALQYICIDKHYIVSKLIRSDTGI